MVSHAGYDVAQSCKPSRCRACAYRLIAVPELAAPRRGRRAWGAGLAVALLFVLSLPAVTTRIYSSRRGGVLLYYCARSGSITTCRSRRPSQHFYDAGVAQARGFHETFLERTTESGRRINFATLGCAILWAPFYAVGDRRACAVGGRASGVDRRLLVALHRRGRVRIRRVRCAIAASGDARAARLSAARAQRWTG